MKKVLIFDFGGTIVTDDSDDRLHLEFYREFIKRFNLPTNEKELYTFLKEKVKAVLKESHKNWRNLKEVYIEALGEFLRKLNIEVTAEHLETFKDLYLRYHEEFTEPFPHVVQTLIKLKSMGFRLAIISNIDNEIIEPVLKRLGILDIFELIVTSEELGFGKPNPKIFEYTLKKLKVSPQDAIFIGDSLTNDVEGAKAVGIKAIHFGKDCNSWQELFNLIIKMGG